MSSLNQNLAKTPMVGVASFNLVSMDRIGGVLVMYKDVLTNRLLQKLPLRSGE